MATFRPRPSSDPDLQPLLRVRMALLRLHKSLIDAERRTFELERGSISGGQLLQALIQDPHFAWLRPYSTLLVQIDEARSADEPLGAAEARILVEQVRELAGSPDALRFHDIRRRDPDVRAAHEELVRSIADALAQEA